MTIVLDPPQVAEAPPAPAPRRRRWTVRLPIGWPLAALLVLYPLWWALGLPTFIYAILAVPMALQLMRKPVVRVPPGFGFWLVLLAWVVLSGLMLGETAPGTLAPEGFGRYIGYVIRAVNYFSLTVIMLYVLNLSERELPRRRVVRMLGFMCLVTVIGGYIGAFMPDVTFISPLSEVVPRAVATDPFVRRLFVVEVAQVQEVLAGGTGQPRPSAPFEYTNTWGENMAVLGVWLVVGWTVLGRRWRRLAGVVVVVASIVPVVASLNRGLWIGIGISAVYVAVRMAWRGRFGALGALAGFVGVLVVLLIATPLGNLVTQRLANGHSDDVRAMLRDGAMTAAASSPVVGYGANRALVGSGRSIAIGKSDECPQCGNREIGSDGQFWHLLVAQGVVGAVCYNMFFLWNLWRFRRDRTAIGIGGSLVLILLLFFQFLYGSLNSTLAYGLITVALMTRNDWQLRRIGKHRRGLPV